ncbi:MAG: PAS domain S-box protein [Bdellovibrio bacteriovorus]
MQNPRDESDAPRDGPVPGLVRLREWISATPGAGFVIVAGTLLVATPTATWILMHWFPALLPLEPLIESVLSVGIVLPLLLFLFVLPSARNMRQREAAERTLRAEREELASRVHERTAELEASNRRLRNEVEGRRRAQQATEFRASLLDAVEQAVVAVDGEGRILYWNRFAEVLYGLKASEAEGRPLREAVSFRQSDGSPLDGPNGCQARTSWSGEVEARRRDGTRVPIHLARSPLPGEPTGSICVSFDISASKAAEEALRESEENYSNLVESSPTGVFIFQDDRLSFVNPLFAELLEYDREELLRVDPWQHVHPDDREPLAEIARGRLQGEPVPAQQEFRLITQSGQVRWVEMRHTLIRYRGSPAVLGNVQDITERRRMEQEVQHLTARLLKVQEEERRRLARDLHDSLGQRLTGIKFLIEASLGPPVPDERRSGILRLRALIPAIQEAVEEVRRISTELRPSILDDLGLVATVGWHLREFAKLHPAVTVEPRLTALESDIPEGLRTPIYRIVQEATNNVAKHSGPCRLVVGLEDGEGRLRLLVSDDGVGFDPDARPRNGRNGGIGLGSMRERAELAGGSFSVRTAPGEGTTIEAEWPLDPPLNA